MSSWIFYAKFLLGLVSFGIFYVNDLFQGVLRIEVLEAKDLVKKDIGVFKKGSSDPYVILRGTV